MKFIKPVALSLSRSVSQGAALWKMPIQDHLKTTFLKYWKMRMFWFYFKDKYPYFNMQ